MLTRRIATFLLGAGLAVLLGGCSALTHASELTITAEPIPPMNAPPPAAVAQAPVAPPSGGAPAPAQGG